MITAAANAECNLLRIYFPTQMLFDVFIRSLFASAAFLFLSCSLPSEVVNL
jgi:hypothetical protein